MVLVWELNFIRNTDGQQKIMISRTYENGKYKEALSSLSDEKIIFINYVSLFPAKDIVRIKLGHHSEFVEINQYSFYYIDKSFFDVGFLGAFGVSEYNENEPFDWPEIEFVAKFLFAEYFKRLKDGRLISAEGSQDYLNWVNTRIQEYYQDYLTAKQEFRDSHSRNTKNTLLQAFQSAAACAEEKAKSTNGRQSRSMSALKEVTPNISQIVRMAPIINEDDKSWARMTREFEFMLINSFGNPLTKIMGFVNGEQKAWGSEEEQNAQSLEGMTYSVLKSFVEQQKLNLKFMQLRKPDNAGYEFILFYSFMIGTHSYLIILNVDNFDPECNQSVGTLRGDEELVLEKIAKELKAHPEWFTEKGEFVDRKIAFEVESAFYRNCKRNFQV
jgi:hypothetical protein